MAQTSNLSCLGSWSAYCRKYNCPVEADCKLELEIHTPKEDGQLKINLGAAKNIREGFINCDLNEGPGIDQKFDAQKTWPFPSECIDYILANHIIEHLSDRISAFKEANRVLKPNGILEIRSPYGDGPHNPDPFHKYPPLWPNSFDYLFLGKKDQTTLECDWENPLFKCDKREILRIFPFRQYLVKLGFSRLERPYTFPLGIKVELHFLLRKVV